MDVIVQPDRILIGAEFVPRRLDLPRVLQVMPGQTYTAQALEEWDYIEVGGTFVVPKASVTTIRFTHFFILPGGMLDCGTEDAPITGRVEFVVNDVPIDTVRDPFQWGNGLLNFGHQERCGVRKLEWTTSATGSLNAGVMVLTLSEDPIGWAIGDELLIPDTLVPIFPAQPRKESRLTVAGITGRTIQLSKPLDFDHPAIMRFDGSTVALLPRVANLTRNIILRSANPSGTLGHTADVGHMAMWCHCSNYFVSLGRTAIGTLDSFNAAGMGHVGTNQVGRYMDHHHHAMGFGSKSLGNVHDGRWGSSKWAMAVHGTHDALIERNVAIDLPGAGYVTEDGYEVRNVFRKNFAAYCTRGNHTGDPNIADANSQEQIPGASGHTAPGSEGNGFWFRGIHLNTFDGNEAWNCNIGINFFNFHTVAGFYPSVPGGESNIPFSHFVAVYELHRGTVAACNRVSGLDYWGAPDKFSDDVLLALNGTFNFFTGLSDNASVAFRNRLFIGHPEAVGIDSQVAYTSMLRLEGGVSEGHKLGLNGGGHYNLIRFERFDDKTHIDWSSLPDTIECEGVDHVERMGQPKRFIVFGKPDVWNGTPPLPPTGRVPFLQQSGTPFIVKNWRKTGQDFRLFQPQQLRETAAWPSENTHPFFWCCPEAGISWGDSWDRYGIGYDGEIVGQPPAAPLEGVEVGLAAPGLSTPLGPPRAVVTLPTPRVPAAVFGGSVIVYLVLTGNPAGTSEYVSISVDGGAAFLSGPPDSGPRAPRSFMSSAIAEGDHEVRTWRTDMNRQPIAATEMAFHYVVGAVATVMVPDVVGMQQADAEAAIVAAGLRVGMVSNVPTGTPGTVTAQNPAGGQQVATNSAVALTVAVMATETWQPSMQPVVVEQFGTQEKFRLRVGNSAVELDPI